MKETALGIITGAIFATTLVTGFIAGFVAFVVAGGTGTLAVLVGIVAFLVAGYVVLNVLVIAAATIGMEQMK